MARPKSGLEKAPGDLWILLAFLNTVPHFKESEGLPSPQALTDWLAGHRLLPHATELQEADLKRAVAVRDALRGLIAARTFGLSSVAAAAQLNQAASPTPLGIFFEADGQVRLEGAADSFDGALGGLLALVATAQLDGHWKRLKTCFSKTCGKVFYDYATNRSAKWCSARCANRISAQVSRRRQGITPRKLRSRS